MKTVSDYLKTLVEDAAVVNTVGGGDVALNTPPIGKVAKRKVEESAEGVTDANATEEEKYAFRQKQAAQQDFSISDASAA